MYICLLIKHCVLGNISVVYVVELIKYSSEVFCKVLPMYAVDFIRYSSKIFWKVLCMWWSLLGYSSKIFCKVLSMYVVEFIEMRHLAWMGAGQTHIRIRSNWKRTKNPASKGPDCG